MEYRLEYRVLQKKEQYIDHEIEYGIQCGTHYEIECRIQANEE